MKNFSIILIILILTAASGLVACSSSGDEEESISSLTAPNLQPADDGTPQYGGELVVSWGVGEPTHFNSAIASGSSTGIIASQVFASPLRYDDDWNPQPYLAKSWSFSDDNLSLTLNLVENAVFHDGHPVTSEDVAFSILTVQKYHPFKSMFAPVTTIDTPDPYTVIVHLSQPHPAILLAMSPNLLPILPKHIYGDGQDIMTHPANLKPIGCGPFKFTEYIPGEKVVLERNDNFFIEGKPYLDQITFRFEDSEAVQLLDMERQEVHMLPLYSNPENISHLAKSENLLVTSQGYSALGSLNWLAFNLLRPPLSDKKVRQAIAYAIDTDLITEYLHQGMSQNAYGPIVPSSPFYDSSIPKYNLNQKKAEQLLDQAGYPVGDGGIRFSLTLDFIPFAQSMQEGTARLIQSQLKEVGIDVKLNFSKNMSTWIEKTSNWDFDMTLDVVYNWGDPVIGVHRSYMSSNIRKGVIWSNTQNYSNPEVDRILDLAGQEPNFSKRKELYSQFQQIIAEDLPVMPLHVMPYHTIYNKNLGNPPVTIWGVHSPFDEIFWKEPIQKVIPKPVEIDDSTGDPRLRQIGQNAIALIRQKGLYDSMPELSDPDGEFLRLEETQFHIFGVTDKGVVFLDNAGLIGPGVDINTMLDLQGVPVLPRMIAAANGQNGGHLTLESGLPHPVTGKTVVSFMWCGWLYEGEMIFVSSWSD